MASQSQKSRSTSSQGRRGQGGRKSDGAATRRSRSSGGQARRASEKTEKYRFAKNVGGEGTVAEREYLAYAEKGDEILADPDVLLDVPVIKVDRIHLELDNLDAHVAVKAKVLDLVNLTVGVDAHLGKLKIDIEGVEAQAMAKIRLDHVAAIVDRVLTTIDRNPKLVEGLSAAVEEVGGGAGKALHETGEAVEEVGEGAGEAVEQVGEGAGQAVGEIGEGAGEAVGQVGEGAGEAVGQVGEGAGQAVGQIGEGAGQAAGNLQGLVGNVGETVGQVGQGAGQAAEGLGQGVGELGQGVGQAAGGVGQAAGGVGDAVQGVAGAAGGAAGGNGEAPGGGAGAPAMAKEAAKMAVKQLGAAATDEAKDLTIAATKKMNELGERRREKRADKHHATAAAMRAAEDEGLDLDDIEGSGSGGRITLRDVQKAARE